MENMLTVKHISTLCRWIRKQTDTNFAKHLRNQKV